MLLPVLVTQASTLLGLGTWPLAGGSLDPNSVLLRSVHTDLSAAEQQTLSQNVDDWPAAGGATGTIRFYPEIEHKANAGRTRGNYHSFQKYLCNWRHV